MAEEARRLRESGTSWVEIGRRLDVRPASLQLWLKQASPRFLPVKFEPTPTPSRDLVLVTPEGFRVEGLDLEATNELLESLRC